VPKRIPDCIVGGLAGISERGHVVRQCQERGAGLERVIAQYMFQQPSREMLGLSEGSQARTEITVYPLRFI
jgi:hypothetical protein